MVSKKLLPTLIAIAAIVQLSAHVVRGDVQRIVGGSTARESQFPYLASVRRNDIHVCGGVIISRTHILTAGRCVVKNFSNDAVIR